MGRTFAAAGAVLLGLALAAAAQEPPAGRDPGAGRWGMQKARGQRLAEYLGLDAQQKEAIRKLRQQQRDDMKPLLEEGRDLRSKLREATDAEKPDALAVGEATLALKAHREKMKAQREAFEQRLIAILTPEQKQKYEALKAVRGFGRSGPRGLRGKGRPGDTRGDL
jgi:Spy/CpxP family protein refolding chaperone